MRRKVNFDNRLSGAVIASAIAVHRELGPGLDESHYQEALSRQLTRSGMVHEEQAPLPLVYKGVKLDCGYRMDLLIDGRLVVEIKSVEFVHPVHVAQLLTYLRISGHELGLLINFDVPVLKDGIQRKVWSHDREPLPDDTHGLEHTDFEKPGLTSELVACAFEVHRTLGPGLLRSAYEECLCYELSRRNLRFERRKSLVVHHCGADLKAPAELRLLVEGRVPVECLSVEELTDLHVTRLLARMRQQDWPEGLLFNFNSRLLGKGGIRRVIK
jgi:GxxExxY protein